MNQSGDHINFCNNFIELDTIDSTNNYALDLINQQKAVSGMAIFAHHQSGGKGQRGKKWLSEKDTSISLSLIIKPVMLNLSDLPKLNITIGLAVHSFVSQYAGNHIRLKWPNDIYWKNDKLGGILIQNKISFQANDSFATNKKTVGAGWSWAVIGIGLNINQTAFPGEIKQAISLSQITGKQYPIVSLAKELSVVVENYLQKLFNNEYAFIHQQYNEVLYKLNDKVKLKMGTRVFDAEIKGVSPLGRLITLCPTETEFALGDVQWVL